MGRPVWSCIASCAWTCLLDPVPCIKASCYHNRPRRMSPSTLERQIMTCVTLAQRTVALAPRTVALDPSLRLVSSLDCLYLQLRSTPNVIWKCMSLTPSHNRHLTQHISVTACQYQLDQSVWHISCTVQPVLPHDSILGNTSASLPK